MQTVHSSRNRILLNGDETCKDDSGNEDKVFALENMPEDSSFWDNYGEGRNERMDEGDDIDDKHYAAVPEEQKSKKFAYYASNAERIESDDGGANEVKEQEAKRLQAKMRDAMADDDFGLEDVVEGLPVDDG